MAFVVVAIVLYQRRHKLAQIPFVGKALALIKNIWKGFISIKKIKSPKEFTLQTLVIWLGYLFTVYYLFKGLPFMENLGLHAALLILVLGSMGMAAPTQNGIGPYHFMVAGGLKLYGVSEIDAVAGALLLHTVQLFGTVFFGGLATAYVFVLKKSAKKTEAQPSTHA